MGDNVYLPDILAAMDAGDVAVSILSARGQMRYSMDIAAFAAAYPDRIIAAVSLKLDSMDRSEQGFLGGLAQQVGSGQFSAIAEMLLYHAEKHDDQGNPTAPEFKSDPSAETTLAVVAAAEQLECPVFLHIEFVSLEQFYGSQERTRFMTEFEDLLTGNPDRAFVLTDVAELYPSECRDLIEAYSNVCFTTNFLDLKLLMTGEPVVGYSETEWLTAFEEHPDRFVFALERVFENQWKNYATDMEITQQWLARLSAEAAGAIAYDNAARLWGISS